jgi:DNA processing protein
MTLSHTLDDALIDHVRLSCVQGIGPRLRRRLIEHFGSPAAVFAAAPEALARVERLGPKLARDIHGLATAAVAEQVLEDCRQHGIAILHEASAGYPRLLGRIDDPPGLLYVQGELEPRDALAVAIVGARHATAYGLKIAEQLGGSLARAGYTVVSGLARGIDAAAHRGALAAGGRTLAVLGSGLLSIYPPEHAELAAAIAANGAVLSEQPPRMEPFAGAFPQRNRIVAGLSLGTVVVQASARSGGLITARLAGEQGREVFAVPGPIDCRMSRGCHQLIRDGATLIGSVDDILDELGPFFETAVDSTGQSVVHPAELRLDDVERRVLVSLTDLTAAVEGGGDIESVVAATGLPASRVLAALAALEIRHIIRRLPGNRFARA